MEKKRPASWESAARKIFTSGDALNRGRASGNLSGRNAKGLGVVRRAGIAKTGGLVASSTTETGGLVASSTTETGGLVASSTTWMGRYPAF